LTASGRENKRHIEDKIGWHIGNPGAREITVNVVTGLEYDLRKMHITR